MVRKLDEILVVDIEATCWEGEPPAGQVSEIIEIGICVLQVATLEIGPARSLLIRPDRSTVSPYCTALTGHSQSEVETGMPLAAACDILAREYGSSARVWASYGDYGREQFQLECAAKDIPYPFSKTHINVKTWLAAGQAWRKEPGLGKALERLNLPFEGTPHRGSDDATNVARLLAYILACARNGCANT